jgi:replicative DNA helicase
LISAHKKLEDYEQILKSLETLKDRQVYYVETAGNLSQIYNTVKHVKDTHPEYELVISLDHTLLTTYQDEKDEIELLAETARLAIQLRKDFEALVILVGQLNDKIEDPKRLTNKAMQVPSRTDIHGSKQIYWACDYIWVAHRPELFNIERYTRYNYETQGLIAMHLIKSRKGVPGLIRLREKLAEGNIIQWED